MHPMCYRVKLGAILSFFMPWVATTLRNSSCALPCEPMPVYTSASSLISNTSNLTSLRTTAKLEFIKIREELKPIMAVAAYNISQLMFCRGYSINVLAPALRRYHEAHVTLRQLEGEICTNKSFEGGLSNFTNFKNSCRPDTNASQIDPRPLDWAHYALAEKTVISKSQIFAQLCSHRKLSSSNPSRRNSREAKNHTTILNLELLESSRAQAIANNMSATTICLSTDFFPGKLLDPLVVLDDLFTAWAGYHSHNASAPSLKGLGKIRIILWGSDVIAPVVKYRSRTGQPLYSRRFLQARFNFTNASRIALAWANFSEWQNMEHEFAVNESLMILNDEWSSMFESWESMGLNFAILTGNMFARHPKVFPLPLGVPNQFQTALARSRYNIRSNVNSFRKKLMLLLNFKAFGGPFRPSSSERQAIYRLATLGDPIQGIKPWTFASIRPSHGKTQYKENRMDFHYSVLASSHFVLSPRGNGLDCFRTWEALSVGTIPIVKRSGPFDAIYEGLPVLLVNRWEDVSLELLERTLRDWRHRRFPNLTRISTTGWLHAGLQ